MLLSAIKLSLIMPDGYREKMFDLCMSDYTDDKAKNIIKLCSEATGITINLKSVYSPAPREVTIDEIENVFGGPIKIISGKREI
jgi:hypothetical protein